MNHGKNSNHSLSIYDGLLIPPAAAAADGKRRFFRSDDKVRSTLNTQSNQGEFNLN